MTNGAVRSRCWRTTSRFCLSQASSAPSSTTSSIYAPGYRRSTFLCRPFSGWSRREAHAHCSVRACGLLAADSSESHPESVRCGTRLVCQRAANRLLCTAQDHVVRLLLYFSTQTQEMLNTFNPLVDSNRDGHIHLLML